MSGRTDHWFDHIIYSVPRVARKVILAEDIALLVQVALYQYH